MGSVRFTHLASNLLQTAVIGFENALLKKEPEKVKAVELVASNINLLWHR